MNNLLTNIKPKSDSLKINADRFIGQIDLRVIRKPAGEIMEIKLKYFIEKDIQMVDVYTGEPSGLPFDQHTIQADINGQIFRESFVVTTLMKEHNYREEALLFGKKLEEIGKMIQRQATKGNATTTICSNGTTYITF